MNREILVRALPARLHAFAFATGGIRGSWVALLFLIILGSKLWLSQTSGFMVDEPESLYHARQIAEGEKPYVDFPNIHAPLTYYVLAPFYKFSIWHAQRVLVALVAVASIWVLYVLLKRMFPGPLPVLGVVLFAVSPLTNRWGIFVIPDSFMVPSLIVALYCAHRAMTEQALRWWFAAGLAVGVALLFKQTAFVMAALMIAASVYSVLATKSVRPLAGVVAGMLAPVAALFVFYLGQWPDLWVGLVSGNQVTYSQPLDIRTLITRNDILAPNPALWAMAIAGALAAITTLVRKRELSAGHQIVLLAGNGLIGVLFVNLFLTNVAWSQYYLQMVPLAVILAVFIINEARNLPIPRILWWVSPAVVFLVFLQPIMISSVPWNPSLDRDLQISDVVAEMGAKRVWEPWVFYAYFADKNFVDEHAALSDVVYYGRKTPIDIGAEIREGHAELIIVHEPVLPEVRRDLELILQPVVLPKWTLAQQLEVLRYWVNGSQPYFWTPVFEPREWVDTVTLWSPLDAK